jgi:hypothetical protein
MPKGNLASTALLITLVGLIAILIVGSRFVTADHVPYLDIVAAQLDPNEVRMRIETAGNANGGIVDARGLAALTDDFQDMLAVTWHGGVGPDSECQVDANDNCGHTHVVDAVIDALCNSTIAVSSASFEQIGDLSVVGNVVDVSNADPSQLGNLNGQILSFTLTVENERVCINPDEFFQATQFPPVGGEILGFDASALFLAGAMTNAYWILPLIAAAGVALIGIKRLIK